MPLRLGIHTLAFARAFESAQSTNPCFLLVRIQCTLASDPGRSQMIPIRIRIPLTVLSLGAGVIHMVVVGPHFHESALAGWFFVGVTVFQIGWSGVLTARADRRVLSIGLFVNLFVIMVWVLSRTVGLPSGLEADGPEAVGFADVVATALEILIVTGTALAIRHGQRLERMPLAVPLGLVFLTILVTPIAITGGFGLPAAFEHHEPSADPGDHHHAGSAPGS
jgi:hypothetical protein